MPLLLQPRRFTLPRVAAPPSRSGLPLLGALAPLVMAVVLWAATQSIFSLLLGLLSPVLALAGLLDRRVSARRRRREEAVRVRRELRLLEDEVVAHLRAETERIALAAARPTRRTASAMVADREPMPLVTLGSALLPSALEWSRAEIDALPAPLAAEARDLISRVELVLAPVVVEADHGVAVAIDGDDTGIEIAAVRRALALSCAVALPTDWSIQSPPDEPWSSTLPHRLATPGRAPGADLLQGTASPDADPAWVLRGPSREIRIGSSANATGAGVRLLVGERDSRLVDSSGDRTLPGFRPRRLSRAQAAQAAAEFAESTWAVGDGTGLPESVAYADLVHHAADDGSLATPIGVDGAGAPVLVDLVGDGPHAIVGGTTGSGKSELLVTWVLGMAARTAPAHLSFLLVDFKGGAAFAPLEALPHVSGVLSDLDAPAARRAVVSLRTELLRRERVLAQERVRSIEELAAGVLPRLVVVVDEFAALITEQPELGSVITDLAARGRSLGIHLVLCTQRPAGIVKDAVLANATLRLSLRVNNRHDSSSVIGSAVAAELPALPRGRGVLAVEGRPVPLQVARATERDVDAVVRSWRGAPTAPAFWTPGLPPRVERSDLPSAPSGGLAFGLVDLPEQQRIGVAAYDPGQDGHLLIIGGRGAGTSTAIAAIAAAAGSDAIVVPRTLADAWAVALRTAETVTTVAGSGSRPVLLVDDVDRLLDDAGDEGRGDFAALLVRAARTLEIAGGALVLGASRPLSGVSALSAVIDRRLLLALPSREDHVIAGGEGRDFSVRRRPGSGIWDGAEVQIAWTGAVAPAAPVVSRVRIEPTAALAVVSGRPDEVLRGLRRLGTPAMTLDQLDRQGGVAPAGTVVVGDVDDWLADYAGLDRARRGGILLVHAATAADVRALTRIRRPLPPLDPRHDEAWRVEGRDVVRVRTPW
ncbi:FtsK/SpoIIIE domain-containing protein [Schumannella soli]|uniref:FtsK domain-containing protein n=1 Tax=Schumannella soli TaxID=2590779 RepID=A0A506Y207_9MICO|nr:FtsK/SpoIIIE domain-containing protein [Schumannella soli]TPW76002.1 hypothetical protein FJ657_09235 [Schumannella soli]